jgi:hypothetical protein
MLVSIDLDVIDSERDFRNLDRLLFLFEEEQHEWYLENTVEEIMERGWSKQLSDRHQRILKEIVQKAYVRSANISNKEKGERKLVQIKADRESSLYYSLRFLDDPLHIVVENETSDSLFLNRLFQIYPRDGSIIERARQLGFLTYYPAGGRNETIKTLRNLAKKKERPYSPRTFVFIDSDKKYPNQPPDEALTAIINYCDTNQIPLHILYKREIENYLPKEVFAKRLPDALDFVFEELCNLSADQWDFFDLEKGFNNHQPTAEDPLFADYSGRRNARYEKLRKGLQINREFIPKQELYKFVDDENFNAKTVNLRCAHQTDKNELLNLLVRIKNYL